MRADAQRSGRPAIKWRPLRKSSHSIPCTIRCKVWLTPAAGVPCSNAANIRERKTWTQSELCTWQNSVRRQKPPKCIYSVPAQNTAKDSAKFGFHMMIDVGAVKAGQISLRHLVADRSKAGRRHVQSWSQTCSELEFGLSSSSLAAN